MELRKKFGTSQSVIRIEDERLLKGNGRYVDDICPEDAYFVSFLRSPIAHGKIIKIDVSEAIFAEGVQAIYTSKNTEAKLLNSMSFIQIENKNGKKGAAPIRPILAHEKVRFVGEAIAAVVARTRKEAIDALELINLDLKEISPHMDIKTGGEKIHSEVAQNKAFDWEFGNGKEVDLEFKNAAHVVSLDLIDNRVCANPIETRGCFAQMKGQRLHFCFSGQGVWNMKSSLARNLGMKKSQIRVTNPDVGGGFGMKSFDYPEYFIVAMAAKDLNKAIRWQAERGESLLADNGARDLVTQAQAAFDNNYKLLSLNIHSVSNLGAYNSNNGQLIQTELALKVLTGAYDVKNVFFKVTGVYTNTSPVDAYRGAGRPEAIYILERLMDYSARVFDLSPVELRRKNFIPPDLLPYQTASGETYDVGNFSKLLAIAENKANIIGFEKRKNESLRNGKLRGLGLCYYIEAILGEQKETTTIELTKNGHFNLYVGTQSNGQGHETVFTQMLHQKTGIPFEKIKFIQGDSDLIPKGGGTGGSRSVTMQGNSIYSTSDILIEKLKILAATELSAISSQVEFEDGYFFVFETNRKIHIMDLALKLAKTSSIDSLKTTHENVVPARSYPYGAHFAEVEVDQETGLTECVKYTVVDDFGILMNPMLVEGQVHGGVAQGIGQVLKENVVFNSDGQLLSGSFMDYSMPRATDIPFMSFHTELIPSTANEIGVKGCGEAGTVGALAAVVNASLDAVWNIGIKRIDMPLTPFSMWNYIKEAKCNQKGETCP